MKPSAHHTTASGIGTLRPIAPPITTRLSTANHSIARCLSPWLQNHPQCWLCTPPSVADLVLNQHTLLCWFLWRKELLYEHRNHRRGKRRGNIGEAVGGQWPSG